MKNTCLRLMISFAVGACIVVGFALIASERAEASWLRQSTSGDLFYNYYSPAVGYESVGARMYPCPRPVPPRVGHTYFTYQPLMPHEFLYRHARVYKTIHSDAPNTRTRVRWR
ncbi:MAG: hypothetical protein GX594_05550 [Pirellulaceae bacterium]|nr:hypothetical protein [Pirellulaceae bacterium]